MGWTCQHDFQGHCKLLNVVCMPGRKGCTLNKGRSEYIFTTGSYEKDKKQQESKQESIDFAVLAKSN